MKLNHFTSNSLEVCYPSGVEIEIKIKKREIKYEILKSIMLLSTVEVMGKTELSLIGFHFHDYSVCINGLNNMVISFIFVRFDIKYCKMDEKIFFGSGTNLLVRSVPKIKLSTTLTTYSQWYCEVQTDYS